MARKEGSVLRGAAHGYHWATLMTYGTGCLQLWASYSWPVSVIMWRVEIQPVLGRRNSWKAINQDVSKLSWVDAVDTMVASSSLNMPPLSAAQIHALSTASLPSYQNHKYFWGPDKFAYDLSVLFFRMCTKFRNPFPTHGQVIHTLGWMGTLMNVGCVWAVVGNSE